MAIKSTIYKANLNIADLNRHYYADHQLTLACHPSETEERLMARLLMFALYASPDLVFAKGLSDIDEPDLWQKNLVDEIQLWVEVGQPDETRIRKGSQKAKQMVVFCYSHHSDVWWQQIQNKLTRFENLTVYQLDSEISLELSKMVQRNMQLQCTIDEDHIVLSSPDAHLVLPLVTLQAPKPSRK